MQEDRPTRDSLLLAAAILLGCGITAVAWILALQHPTVSREQPAPAYDFGLKNVRQPSYSDMDGEKTSGYTITGPSQAPLELDGFTLPNFGGENDPNVAPLTTITPAKGR